MAGNRAVRPGFLGSRVNGIVTGEGPATKSGLTEIHQSKLFL